MRSVLLFLLIIARIDTINAQPVKLLAHIGAGTSYNSKQRSDNYYMQATRFKPAMYYKAALALQVPIANHVAFETGIGYERRTIRSVQSYYFDNTHSLTNNAKLNYHYIALPIQLSVCLYQSKQKQFWINGGINYGFLIQANKCISTTYYYNGTPMNQAQEDCYNLSVVLFRDESRFNTQPYRQLYAFDVATSLGLSYTITSRIAIRAHYNYSLYNTEITSDGNIHQHNTGLSFLFRLI